MDITVFGSSSKGNCYHVSDTSPLLLDAGIPFKEIQRKLNFQTSSIAGALITHQHMDHCKAVKDLIKAGIDCYMNEATKTALGVSGHRVKVIAPMEQFKIGEWSILAFMLEHDVDNLGYLLANDTGQKIVYITDSYFCRYRFNGLTHIMIEVNYDQATFEANNGADPIRSRLMRSHFSLENAVDFLKANDLSKVEQIMVLHLSDKNANEKLIKETIQQVTGKHVVIAG